METFEGIMIATTMTTNLDKDLNVDSANTFRQTICRITRKDLADTFPDLRTRCSDFASYNSTSQVAK